MLDKSEGSATKNQSIKQEVNAIKRRGILDEARRQFYENGYEATSLDSISEALGVSKQFIYSRFKTKSELLVELCRAGAFAAESTVEYAKTLTDAPTDRLAKIISYFVQRQIKHRREVALYFREANSLPEEEAAAMNLSKMRFHRMLCEVLADGKDQGVFHFEDVSITASALGGMASWTFFWFQPDDYKFANTVAQQMSTIALQAAGVTDIEKRTEAP